ncbi:hypothetical protein [Butyrivibrio sp.]|uniref:hypothetical protein n=1 Tax=Butyrivibrio sp. TaxID=28121 RepID=UPI0025C37683|nr:hypothetical protein [Butyrivibrio sp.]MBE5837180.1 hypothetical protein [Butyrivibrio sp.]
MDNIRKIDRKNISNTLYYVALTIELFFMLLEKSEISIPFISHVFRVTFLLTLIAVLIMKHDKKEWLIIIATFCFTFICYRITGRNELLRFSMFVFAAKDINLEKTMKYWFYFCLAGFILITALSLIGVMGDVYVDADFGRGSVERRYTLGFGHPNTLCGCAYVILLLWLWLYGKRAGIVSYLAWIVGTIVLYKFSVSRTIILIFMMTIALAMIVRFIPVIKEKKLVYILAGLVSPGMCVLISVVAAIASKYRWTVLDNGEVIWQTGNELVAKLDEILNGRIANLYYDSQTHEGAVETWKFFSDRNSDRIFDMGWVRLYYWYGIVPATVVVILILLLIYLCYKEKDIWTVLIVFSLGVYTIIEATFVSRYIGRNLLIPIAAAYLYRTLQKRYSEF